MCNLKKMSKNCVIIASLQYICVKWKYYSALAAKKQIFAAEIFL